jgi:hypothetical protein
MDGLSRQVPLDDADGMKQAVSDGLVATSSYYDEDSGDFIFNFEPPRRSRYDFGRGPFLAYGPVGLAGPGEFPGLPLGGFVPPPPPPGGAAAVSDGGSYDGSNPPGGSPPSPTPPPPPSTDLIVALLNMAGVDDRPKLAADYLEHIKRREDWKVMQEAVVLDDPDVQWADKREIIRAKFGLPTGEHQLYLAEVVKLAAEVNHQVRVWRKLALPAVILMVVGIVAAGGFTYKGFQLVSNGKMNGYELVVVIFVLALVAISPAVLLLLQRPLKSVDEWSPTLSKPGDDAEKDKKS